MCWMRCGIVVELLLHGVVVVGAVCERCVHVRVNWRRDGAGVGTQVGAYE